MDGREELTAVGESEEKKQTRVFRFVVLYTVIIIAFLVLLPGMLSSDWKSSADFHSCIQITGALIAIIASIACLMYYLGLESKYFFVVSLGFMADGSENLVHGLLEFRQLFDVTGMEMEKFFPGTDIAGNSLLAILIIIAMLVGDRLKRSGRVRREAARYSLMAFLLGGGVTAAALFIPLPEFIYPEKIVSRPVDLIIAILFLAAFFLAFRRFMEHKDIFTGMLIASILLTIGGQVYLSFSTRLYDIWFDVAHWAKTVSFIFPILGITIEASREMKRSREAEYELITTEVKLRQVFHAVSPLYAAGRDYKLLSVNNSFASMFGKSREQVKEHKCYEVVKSTVCRTSLCPLKNVSEAENEYTTEALTHNGKSSITMAAKEYRSPEGNIIGIVCTINDITDRKRVENELKKRVEEIEVQDWVKTGQTELSTVMRGEIDVLELSGRIISCLAGYLDAQTGALYLLDDQEVDPEESRVVYRMTGSYAYNRRRYLSGEIELGQGLVGQAALEKKSIFLNKVPDDYMRISTGLGHTAPKYVLVFPLVFDNEVRGVLELGKLEKITEIQERFLLLTQESIIISLEAARSRQRMEKLLRATQDQAIELQIREEELQASNEELEEQTSRLQSSEEALKTQQEELQATNEELEEKTESLEEQTNKISRSNIELEKIRVELERKADELEISSRYKSEFLANMSHELRTPLNSLLILSQDLAGNKKGNLASDQVKSAEIIYNSGNDLLKLINEILDLSKIEAGKMTLHLEEVSLDAIERKIRDNFEAAAREKEIDFQVWQGEGIPKIIRTDAQKLDQVLKNLVSNAIKFTEEGSVTVTMQRPSPGTDLSHSGLTAPETIAFSIIDTGIGIPEEMQYEVFEAFQQGDGSTSRMYGGTGLGLSISRELASLLGGAIELKSIAGEGTTFTLYVPELYERRVVQLPERRTEERVETQAATATPRAIMDDRKSVRDGDRVILVIEDDSNFAKILYDLCQERHFQCIHAANGEEGLELAGQYIPEAIILDNRLPGMHGIGVLEELKDNSETRHIPVHMISVDEDNTDAFLKGAIGYLTKPVKSEELNAAFTKIEKHLTKNIKDLLVVSGDDDIMRGIIELIGNGDVKTDKAAQGMEALDLLGKKTYDCMILNLNLPDMTGVHFLWTMERGEGISIPPVIVYAGRELSEEEEQKLERYTGTLIVKEVRSEERLLDETALFLHRVVDKLPENKKKIITRLHDKDQVFRGKRILLVDDDMRNVFAVARVLEDNNMEVAKASNGKKALEILEEDPYFDLVLMDIMMPVMDGYQAMKIIRKQERFKKLPIIALTAKAMKLDRERSIEAGASDYLAKPIEIGRLLSLMRVWLYQ
ncbi:MAG: response regulator [bacterium]|nr:response regulator [bacterium]